MSSKPENLSKIVQNRSPPLRTRFSQELSPLTLLLAISVAFSCAVPLLQPLLYRTFLPISSASLLASACPAGKRAPEEAAAAAEDDAGGGLV